MKHKTMHIAFCVNEAYVQYITVTMKSIAENNREAAICIHVLSNAVSPVGRQRLEETIEEYKNVSLHIHEVDDSPLKGLYTGNFTIYTWYRILLPNILPSDIDRVLYLDADTLVTADLKELFALDMTGKAIAAAPDIQSWLENAYVRCGYEASKQYICAGVLLMNLDYWREHELADKMVKWAIQKQDLIKCPDQDAINYICRDTKIILPLRYGFMHCFCEYDMFYNPPYRVQLEESILSPAIIHYNGCAPWAKEYHKHLMHHRWEKYNRMLHRPVKRTYQAKGWLKLKIITWDLLHLYRNRRQLTLDQVKSRLQNT